jgi:hypothetical protein
VTEWLHRTCQHAADRIDGGERYGTLTVVAQVMLGRLPMVWLTSSQSATRVMLGLSSHTLECDRMEALYRVLPEDAAQVIRWGDLVREPSFEPYLPGARRLMAVRGTRPGVWGVSPTSIRVERIA